MTAPEPAVPVERVREAALRAVAERGLRKVAREVGVSTTGFSHFLKGGEPFPANTRKLTEWYVRDAAAHHGLDDGTAAAALSLLVDGLPAEEAAAMRECLLAALRDGYGRSGAPLPGWLQG